MNVPTIVSPPMSSGSSAATASEEDQRQQEEQRECEELGRPKVPLDLIVDLLLGDCRSADRDAGLVVERAGDPLGGVLERVVVRGLQRDGEVGRVAVSGDEVARSCGQEAGHGGDVRVLLDLTGDLLDSVATLARAHVGAVDEHDDPRFPEARVLEPLVGDHALGVRVVGAVGIEPIRDAGAERSGHDEEERRDDQHALRPALRESRQQIHHDRQRIKISKDLNLIPGFQHHYQVCRVTSAV